MILTKGHSILDPLPSFSAFRKSWSSSIWSFSTSRTDTTVKYKFKMLCQCSKSGGMYVSISKHLKNYHKKGVFNR